MREYKGHRLDDFPENYIVVDLETTSYIPTQAEIIEIGAVKISNKTIVDEFTRLVKPSKPIPTQITELTGITNDMLENASDVFDALSEFAGFIGDSILVGYNITTFDYNILYDKMLHHLNIPLSNDFVDVLYSSQKRLDLPNYKLSTVCDYLQIKNSHAHRAISDCIATNDCYIALSNMPATVRTVHSKASGSSTRHTSNYSEISKALQKLEGIIAGIIMDDNINKSEFDQLLLWLNENTNLSGNYPYDSLYAKVNDILSDGIVEPEELDDLLIECKKLLDPVSANSFEQTQKELSIKGKHICLTGEFDFGSRSAVFNLLEEKGAVMDKSVTLKTEYVVVGSQGSQAWKCGKYGGKIKKAVELQEKGRDIHIISEKDFFKEML